MPSSASAASTASATGGWSPSASGVSSKPRPDADQQLVVEVLAQPGQRAAHRRLAHRHPLAGVGEVALLEQRVQREQQVGVDLAQPLLHPTSSCDGPHPSDSALLGRMALGGTDLNLLLPLKVLLEEGNVTRAGQRLELSQPAMSAALARLRRRFDDELLVRAGRDYELTPFARDLLPEVQHARTADGHRALHLEDEFDPATSERTFRLAMSDYAIAVVHEPLVRLVEAEAPGVRLAIEHLGPDARESDRVLLDYDALIAPLGFGFPGESRPLWRDRMVARSPTAATRGCVDGRLTLGRPRRAAARRRQLRPRHPDARRPRLRRARHRPPHRPAGRRASCRCRSSSRAPRWSPSSRRSWPGCTCATTAPVVMVEPPFDEVVLAEGYWFAADRLSDPAHRWLFGRLDAVR